MIYQSATMNVYSNCLFSLSFQVCLCVFSIKIVLCAGGQYLDKMPTKKDEETFIISCSEDKSSISKALKAGIAVQDKEVLLTGLLRQKLELDKYKLSL